MNKKQKFLKVLGTSLGTFKNKNILAIFGMTFFGIVGQHFVFIENIFFYIRFR